MSAWRKQVPKAPLVRFEWLGSRPGYVARFRLANAWRFQIGRLCVMVRAPYLEHVARVHYPDLFASKNN